jgi:O-antigen/teichoic acid export membrane protein
LTISTPEADEQARSGQAAEPSVNQETHLDRESGELRAKFLEGVLWQGSLRWLAQLLSWASTLTVARHLSVEAYGIVSVSVVFVAVTGYVTESGLGRTIVLRNITAPKVLGQLHSIAMLIGLTFASLMLMFAVPIASFFHNKEIAAPLAAWSVALVISGAITVPSAILQQRLAYRRVAVIELVRSVSQALVVLALAVSGASYWALVAGFIVSSFVGLVGYTTSAWLSFVKPRVGDVSDHLRYAKHLITGNLAWYAYSNSDFLVVGRMLSVATLGVYQFAWNIAQLPGEKLTNVVQAAIAPVLGLLGDRPAEMRDMLTKATALIALVVFPVIAGIGVLAPVVIPAVFGDRWLAAIPAMRILLAFGALQSVTVCLTMGLNASGLARSTSRMSLLLAAASTLGFVAAVNSLGIAGVAAVHLLLQPAVSVYVIRQANKAFGLRFSDVFAAIAPACSATIVMLLVCSALLRLVAQSSATLTALLISSVGSLAFGATLLIFHRTSTIGLIRSFRGPLSRS